MVSNEKQNWSLRKKKCFQNCIWLKNYFNEEIKLLSTEKWKQNCSSLNNDFNDYKGNEFVLDQINDFTEEIKLLLTEKWSQWGNETEVDLKTKWFQWGNITVVDWKNGFKEDKTQEY